MKATIDFDPALFQRLKIEAARRGRTVKDLVAEGVRAVLARPSAPPDTDASRVRPPWLGALRRYAKHAHGAHDLDAVRKSIVRGRAEDRR